MLCRIHSFTVTLISEMELFVILFIFSVLFGVSEASCDSQTGPLGPPECVILDGYYGDAQWATCLTDTYIKTYSKQKQQCEGQSTTYCYYQCMMELHTVKNGLVIGECRCNGTSRTSLLESSTIIPDTCYSPAGDDCSWYRNCLEKRYPCKQQGESYALDYAEKFCNLYDKHYSNFDRKGQQWINAVRKCLQVKLVPILRPFASMTCDEINLHADCYDSPDDTAPSICDIGILNWMRVFVTIKSAFKDAPFDSLKQSIITGSKCVSNWVKSGIQHISIFFSSKNSFDERLLNTRIVEPLADNGKWNDNGIQYIGYSLDEDDSSFRMVVLLMPSKQYDLNYQGTIVANATSAALDAADAVQSGQVQFRLPGNVQALNFSVCEDDECSVSIKSVLVPITTNAAERISPFCRAHLFVLLFVCYRIVKRWSTLE